MRIAVLVVLLLLAAMSVFAADVTGRWQFNVETEAGSGTPTFVLQQTGESLSGTYSGQLGEAKVTGLVKGNKVTIQFEASDLHIVYEGTLDEHGNLKGTVDLGSQAKGTFTGSKQ